MSRQGVGHKDLQTSADVYHDTTRGVYVASESLQVTVRNVRLWDREPLLQTYGQLQSIRTYYDFVSVDDDRYRIGGELRQVLLAPRELNTAALPTRTFVKTRERPAARMVAREITERPPASRVESTTRPLGSRTWATTSRVRNPPASPESDAKAAVPARMLAASVPACVRSPGSSDDSKPLRNDPANKKPPITTRTSVAAANDSARRSRMGTAQPSVPSRRRYPTPRTVSMSERPNGRSTLRRK